MVKSFQMCVIPSKVVWPCGSAKLAPFVDRNDAYKNVLYVCYSTFFRAHKWESILFLIRVFM
jgi:hypothetical protein